MPTLTKQTRRALNDELFDLTFADRDDLFLNGVTQADVDLALSSIQANDGPRAGAFLGGAVLTQARQQQSEQQRFDRVNDILDRDLKDRQELRALQGQGSQSALDLSRAGLQNAQARRSDKLLPGDIVDQGVVTDGRRADIDRTQADAARLRVDSKLNQNAIRLANQGTSEQARNDIVASTRPLIDGILSAMPAGSAEQEQMANLFLSLETSVLQARPGEVTSAAKRLQNFAKLQYDEGQDATAAPAGTSRAQAVTNAVNRATGTGTTSTGG